MYRAIAAVVTCTFIASCGDGETAQITRGGNEIGPATTDVVNERAIEVPAVRNTAATEPQQPQLSNGLRDQPE
jgi:hypothetical protein